MDSKAKKAPQRYYNSNGVNAFGSRQTRRPAGSLGSDLNLWYESWKSVKEGLTKVLVEPGEE